MTKKTPITKDDARRIQSHADKTGTNQDWKARAMSAADRGEPLPDHDELQQESTSNDSKDD